MKGSLLKVFAVATLSLANIAHADFIFHSNDPDVCKNIAGQWTLTGKASNWLFEECVYQGLGNVSLLNNEGKFLVDVSATKERGSFLCPNQTATQLTGVCVGGVATVTTDYGSLSGSFTNNTGEAKGALTVSPGVDVDVSIQFLRVGA